MESAKTEKAEGETGFKTSGFIDKKGTPHGEGVSFNHMPPGEDIGNQVMSDQRPMPFKTLVNGSFPGDGY